MIKFTWQTEIHSRNLWVDFRNEVSTPIFQLFPKLEETKQFCLFWSKFDPSPWDEIQPIGYSVWLPMSKSQQSWVRSQHSPTQWISEGRKKKQCCITYQYFNNIAFSAALRFNYEELESSNPGLFQFFIGWYEVLTLEQMHNCTFTLPLWFSL
jgi:hypothetical protein